MDSNGRCRNRTCDPLIKSQLPQNDNHNQNKDLSKPETTAYKPAYKENTKTAENQAQNLSPDLAEIVAAWSQLPEAIRSAIIAIVRASYD